jgi:hypothetical protein
MRDLDRFADAVLGVVKSVGDRLSARITALEQRALVKGDPGDRGERGERGEKGEKGEPGERGSDGKDADPEQVTALQAQVDLLQGELATAKALIAELHAKSLEPQPDVSALVAEQVTKAMAELPVPEPGKPGKDGTSVTLEDVVPVIASEVQKAVSAMPPPKDGVGLTGALIDHDGHLVLTLSDGTTKTLSKVTGRDGKDVDQGEVMKFLLGEVAKLPAPKDGAPGKDGQDGVGFDDMTEAVDETGRPVIKFVKGDRVKTFPIPGLVDRGVWRPDTAYVKGDGVTFGGSFFIAQVENPAGKPEESPDWRLAVKRGREGKAGLNGKDGAPGKDGKPGRDGKW